MKNTTRESLSFTLEGIKEPSSNDVLSGRGGRSNHHAGNVHFRKVVNKIRPIYIRSNKREKPHISYQVVEEIRGLDPTGRFLQEEKKSGLWYEIGDKRAREKASQALRDGTGSSIFCRKIKPNAFFNAAPRRKLKLMQGNFKCPGTDDLSTDIPSLARTESFEECCNFKEATLRARLGVKSISKVKTVQDDLKGLMFCSVGTNKNGSYSVATTYDLTDSTNNDFPPLDLCRYQSLMINDEIIGDTDYFGLGDAFDDYEGINIIKDSGISSNPFFSFFDIPEPPHIFIGNEIII